MAKNEPAFPINIPERTIQGERVGEQIYKGMTLRDYLAGQVVAQCYKQVASYCDTKNMWPEDWPYGVAHDAYRIADAMLAEREKTDVK